MSEEVTEVSVVSEVKPKQFYIPTCLSMTPRGGVMRECGAQTVQDGRCAEHYERKTQLGV